MTAHSGKIFAIGDIHGSYSKLCTLLGRLPYRPGHDRLVFLGDYINRGNETSQVLDLLCRLKQEDPQLIALLGNHEHLLLEYEHSGDQTLLPFLRSMGIDTTLSSYDSSHIFNIKNLEFMPAEHRRFLHELLPYWENDRYIFVHAGLTPNLPLEKNDLQTLCEARDSFFTMPHDFGKKIIFGHTPFELPFVSPNKIGIDTGAVYGNLLTAIELPGENFYHA